MEKESKLSRSQELTEGSSEVVEEIKVEKPVIQSDVYKEDAYKSDGALMTEEEYDEIHEEDYYLGRSSFLGIMRAVLLSALILWVGLTVLDAISNLVQTSNVTSPSIQQVLTNSSWIILLIPTFGMFFFIYIAYKALRNSFGLSL